MFLNDCWYVGAWAHEVPEQGFLVRKLLEKDLIFYRSADHGIVAMDDRCCHRWAPLSHGKHEGNSVVCMYHGLRFDADGRCIEIPGQEKIPAKARVHSYPVVERYGWVWIWMGDAALADPALIPDAWSLDSPDWAMKPGYLNFQASYLAICDNLLDFSHLTYVHPNTLGGTNALSEQRPAIKQIERGVNVERWIINDTPAPFHKKVGAFETNVDRWYIYDFLVPGVLLMHSGVQATNTGAREGNIQNALEFRSCQAVTPETRSSSHYFFAVPHNFRIDDPSITQSIYDSVITAFAEDRAMIEAQQRIIDTQPEGELVAIVADAALAQYRSILEGLIHAEKVREVEASQGVAAATELQRKRPERLLF